MLYQARKYSASAKRTLAYAVFIGYGWCAGVTLYDLVFKSLAGLKLGMFLGSFLMFWMAAQANASFLMVDSRSRVKLFSESASTARSESLPPIMVLRIILQAFIRTFLVASIAMVLSLVGRSLMGSI